MLSRRERRGEKTASVLTAALCIFCCKSPLIGKLRRCQDQETDIDIRENISLRETRDEIPTAYNRGLAMRHRELSVESLESRKLLTTLADLDGDGDLDAYGSSVWHENVDGNGNFFPRQIPVVNRSPNAHFDMDGDGDLDLLADVRWYENTDGKGDYSIGHRIARTVDDLMDVGGDGDIDVIAIDENESHLLENDGTGDFKIAATVSVPAEGQFDAGDLDQDGDLDFLIVEEFENAPSEIWHYENQGDGTFDARLF